MASPESHEPPPLPPRRATRKRGLLWLGLLVGLGTIGVALTTWLTCPRPGITRDNYEAIGGGMTKADVEALLGGPANGLQPFGVLYSLAAARFATYGEEKDIKMRKNWTGPEAWIVVAFNEAGRVVSKSFDGPRVEASFFERMRRLLRP